MRIFSALARRFSLSLLVVDASISVDVGTNEKRYAVGVSFGPGFVALNRDGDIARFYGKDLSDKLSPVVRDFYYNREWGNTAPVREEMREYARKQALFDEMEAAPETLRYA